MIVVDTSALAEIFFLEPNAPASVAALQRTPRAYLSAAAFLEIAIVIDDGDAPEQLLDLDAFLANAGAEIVPVTAAQARLAHDAYRRFGRGNQPANLNFGACFAYALAEERDLPLLFMGEDFTRTDLRPAM